MLRRDGPDDLVPLDKDDSSVPEQLAHQPVVRPLSVEVDDNDAVEAHLLQPQDACIGQVLAQQHGEGGGALGHLPVPGGQAHEAADVDQQFPLGLPTSGDGQQHLVVGGLIGLVDVSADEGLLELSHDDVDVQAGKGLLHGRCMMLGAYQCWAAEEASPNP